MQSSSAQSASQPAHIAAHKYIKDLQHYEGISAAKDNDDKGKVATEEREGGAKKPRTDDDVLGKQNLPSLSAISNHKSTD